MNQLQKHLTTCVIALVTLLSVASMAMAAPATDVTSFAILSAAPGNGGAVTLTDSTIYGDVGSSGLLASVVQTRSKISGSIIAPVSDQVVIDFNAALQAGLTSIVCDSNNTITGTLAGTSLSSGTYCISPEAKTGTLTLTGTGPWNFIVVGDISTGYLVGTNFNVVLADSNAAPCDVTWYVPSYATMTTSNFVGTIYAGAAITITGGTFSGDALASAAVTTTGSSVLGCFATGHHVLKAKCNQGVGNGPEACDPGNSNQGNPFNSNDELGGVPGAPGRQGGNNK
jgi:hypothetical protein